MKKLITCLFFFAIQIFAGIGVGESPTAPLPVELTSFTANLSGSNVELCWVTATEVKNYGFEIERASSSTSPVQGWEKIGFVNGYGNSNSPKAYSYSDNVNNGFGYYSYRLKQIDTDGKFNYSNIVLVVVNQTPDCFKLISKLPESI